MSLTRPQAWPSFDAPLLESISQAFLGRQDTAKQRYSSFLMSREVEDSDAEPPERLNVDTAFTGLKRPVSIRLSVWPDGALWFRACEPGKRGWAFLLAFQGQLPGPHSSELVRLFEETTVHLSARTGDAEERVLRLWSGVSPTLDTASTCDDFEADP